MKKQVIIVFLTDAWHAHSSKELLGVGDSYSNAVKIASEWFKKNGYKNLSVDDLRMLEKHEQTQGRTNNILFETVTLNKLQ